MAANYGEESRRIHGTQYKYDVFLSFRGEDTRYGFIGYLREKLQEKEINSFADDNNDDFPPGEDISDAISEAIKESKNSIIVLSKNYATSTWCLRELIMILDRKKKNEQHVIPVFYHVDPSDVRKLENSYKDAINAQENRLRENPEQVQTWRSALSEICNLKGFHITSKRYEIEYIKEIVKAVYARIEQLRKQDFADKVSVIKQIYLLTGILMKSLMDLFERTLQVVSNSPPTTQNVNKRCYFLSTREMSPILWSEVSKETCKLEILMPETEIPDWFHFRGNEGNPHFWARGKLPNVALALVFQDLNEMVGQSCRQFVELHLVVNNQPVSCKDNNIFRIASDHVLVCDLRLLFSDEEWSSLNAFLQHDWNLVQVSYNSTMMLSSWGVFVYKQGTKMEDVKFMCPDPKYSCIANTSQTTTVPTRDPKLELRRKMEEVLVKKFIGLQLGEK